MAKEKKEQRFVVTYKQGGELSEQIVKVYVDKQTGVNYLYVKNGYSGGLTPLLDAAGNPITTSVADL